LGIVRNRKGIALFQGSTLPFHFWERRFLGKKEKQGRDKIPLEKEEKFHQK
jgi:hypothetical protein